MMHRIGKNLLCLVLTGLLAACNTPEPAQNTHDVLTQKTVEEGRTPITVLVKYAFSINAFEKEVETLFPTIDIIQVGNHTGDRGIVEYERRMEHDDLPDIVMAWPLDTGKEYWEDRLLDMSSMPFTSQYNLSMLNRIATVDGKLYYLPGPAQVRGIVYNKTLFEEKGWRVPRNFDGFVALCKQIEDSGMRSIQLGFNNPEVLDTAFVGFSYDNGFSTPADAQWLADYNQGRGSIGDRLVPALDTFVSMIHNGIWKQKDLDVDYSAREAMLFTRNCAMVEDSVLIARMGRQITGTTDVFELMPFFSRGQPSDWARLYMVCYIGLNKHLAEPKNKDKFELVMQLMGYISSPEGQTALAADTGAMYSSLKNLLPPDIPEIQELRATLSHGRYGIFPELKNAQTALREGLAGMLRGNLTKADVIRMVDKQNLNPPSTKSDVILTTATADFTLIQTGNLVTDLLREKAGADFSLFLDNGKDGRYNGKGISARLYKGPQTLNDIERILPDRKDQHTAGLLHVVKIKGKDLVNTLEYAVPVFNDMRGWFYYFSGLKMDFAPTAEPGNRVRKLSTSTGEPIDPEKVYTVAIMDTTMPSEVLLSVTDTHEKIQDVIVEALKGKETIAPSNDRRFTIVGP